MCETYMDIFQQLHAMTLGNIVLIQFEITAIFTISVFFLQFYALNHFFSSNM